MATMNTLAPESCHEHLLQTTPRSLAFDEGRDLGAWRREVDATLRELVGARPARTPPDLRVEHENETDLFRETRFVFRSEPHADVPCHLLLPQEGEPPFPLVICLQGHSSGMHISLGRPRVEGDEESIAGDRDFAIQAVREGYGALALEQRCFGEREDRRPPERATFGDRCQHATMTALLLGRTMIGERAWDVSRAIDVLGEFPEVDAGRIGCMGNSGGGTITYFAACLDERIQIAMPSCYVCTFRDSIGAIDHCADNYIPGILRYFEMGDLACLIAPRPLVVVAGRQDDIFPIAGVEETFDTIRRIYTAAGAPNRCRLVVGEDGHRFYADLAWPVFGELSGWGQES
jgi:dienelactone hydrolase